MRRVCIRALYACLLTGPAWLSPAYGQPASDITSALDIITHAELPIPGYCVPDKSDDSTGYWLNCCGSPGRRGCVLPPACVGPTALAIDSYSNSVNCELHNAPACDTALLDLVHNNRIAPGGHRDFTFYATSDIHFFRDSYQEPGQINHVKMMNDFLGAKVWWPDHVGLPQQPIPPPSAVIMNGDLTTYGHDTELGAYRLLWERGNSPDSIKYPVFFGLGNHDIKGGSNNDGHRMYDYLINAMSSCLSGDPGSGNYSWEWHGVHMVQLNTWANDQSSNWPHLANGLQWLQNDLSTYVGNTTKPVMIFQHYGLSKINGQDGPWWSSEDFNSFWNVIKQYNVIGMFSGHTHNLAIHRLGDSDVPEVSKGAAVPVENTSKFEPILDDFEDGSGGDTGHTNPTGNFLAVRVTDDYLDVAALTWGVDAAEPDNTINFLGGSAGCRKKINSRFIPIPNGLVSVSGGSFGYTITNQLTTTFPGPLAIQVPGNIAPPGQDFVDSCSTRGNAYYIINNGADLGPQQTVVKSFGQDIGSAQGHGSLVAIAPLSGVTPGTIDLISTSGTRAAPNVIVPAPQPVTIYGPPSTSYTIRHVYTPSNVTGWVQLQSVSLGNFDAFGRSKFTVGFVQSVLQSQPAGDVSDLITFTQSASGKTETLLVNLHVRAPVTVSLSANPAGSIASTGHPVFSATLTYEKVARPAVDGGGFYQPTGIVTLRELTPDSTGKLVPTTLLASAPVNGNQDCVSGLSWPADSVVFGDTGGNGHFCVSGALLSLPRGVYEIAAYYEGSGNGDNKFAPSMSNIVEYDVFNAAGSLDQTIESGNDQFGIIKEKYSPLRIRVFNTGMPDVGRRVSLSINDPTFATFSGGPSASQDVVFTDRNGIATSHTLTATSRAGTFTVSAKADGAFSPLTFTLTNVALGGNADLLVTLSGKSDSLASRTWQFTMSNPSQAPLVGLTLSNLTLTQEAGAPCTPVIQSGVPFTASVLTPGSQIQTNVTLNFGSCAATARFLVSAAITANADSYKTTATIGHQFP